MPVKQRHKALRQHLEAQIYRLGVDEATHATKAGMEASDFFFTFCTALIEQAALAASAGLVEATKHNGDVKEVRALKRSLRRELVAASAAIVQAHLDEAGVQEA